MLQFLHDIKHNLYCVCIPFEIIAIYLEVSPGLSVVLYAGVCIVSRGGGIGGVWSTSYSMGPLLAMVSPLAVICLKE